MLKKLKKSKKIEIGIKCQCQNRAVDRPESMLKKARCKKCGKIFSTNDNIDFCFDCAKKIHS